MIIDWSKHHLVPILNESSSDIITCLCDTFHYHLCSNYQMMLDQSEDKNKEINTTHVEKCAVSRKGDEEGFQGPDQGKL